MPTIPARNRNNSSNRHEALAQRKHFNTRTTTMKRTAADLAKSRLFAAATKAALLSESETKMRNTSRKQLHSDRRTSKRASFHLLKQSLVRVFVPLSRSSVVVVIALFVCGRLHADSCSFCRFLLRLIHFRLFLTHSLPFVAGKSTFTPTPKQIAAADQLKPLRMLAAASAAGQSSANIQPLLDIDTDEHSNVAVR